MGWSGAVDAVQAGVRKIVFEEAKIPSATEVRKDQPLPPSSGSTVVYLDGFYYLRALQDATRRLAKEGSPEHHRFVQGCKRLGLSLNQAKSLVGAAQAPILGGELLGSLDDLGKLGGSIVAG